MKTVILCGGRGMRLGEHGINIPKALIEIGGKPLLWHLLKYYAYFGLNDFVLCLGYLGSEIQSYFEANPEDWYITFADTGLDTNTGGRLKLIKNYLGNDEEFCVTYGDGLANVDLPALLQFHRSHHKIATLTAVNPRSQFGVLKLDEENSVTEFQEKPLLKEWINGGFFVFNRRIFDYLNDDSILEREPFEQLAIEREVMAFKHAGFWKCLDTYKDNLEFNQLWDENEAAWKLW
jgi:glucose-1-phosphate cytidylyltransferase